MQGCLMRYCLHGCSMDSLLECIMEADDVFQGRVFVRLILV
jgi:hypothetical protein